MAIYKLGGKVVSETKFKEKVYGKESKQAQAARKRAAKKEKAIKEAGKKSSRLAKLTKKKTGVTQVISPTGELIREETPTGARVLRVEKTTTPSGQVQLRRIKTAREAAKQDITIKQRTQKRQFEAQQRFLDKAIKAINESNARAEFKLKRQEQIDKGIIKTRAQQQAALFRNIQQQRAALGLGDVYNPLFKKEQIRPIIRLEQSKNVSVTPPSKNAIYLKNVDRYVYPRTKGEEKFFRAVDKVTGRDERFKAQVASQLKKLGLNINQTDRWYTKALKGVGVLAVNTLYTGQYLANAADKAQLQVRGVLGTKDVRKATAAEAKRAISIVPKTVVQTLDPRKPENWANIVAIFLGVKGFKVAKKGAVTKPTPKANAAVKNALFKQKKTIALSKRTIQQSIKKGLNIKQNKLLLKKVLSNEKRVLSFDKAYKRFATGKKLSKSEVITLDKVLKKAKKSKPVDIVQQSLVRARKLSTKEKIVAKAKALKPTKKVKAKTPALVKARKIPIKEKIVSSIKEIFTNKKRFQETNRFLVSERSAIKSLKQQAIKLGKNNPLYRKLTNYEKRVKNTLGRLQELNKKPRSITRKQSLVLDKNIKAIKGEIAKRQLQRDIKAQLKKQAGLRVKAPRKLTKKEIQAIRTAGKKLNKLIDEGTIKSQADLAKSIKPLVRGKVRPVFEAEVAKRLLTKARKGEVAKRQLQRQIKKQVKEQAGLRVKAPRKLTKKEIAQAKKLEKVRRVGVVKAPVADPAKTFRVVFKEQPIVKGLRIESTLKTAAAKNNFPSNIVVKKNNFVVRAKKTTGNTYSVKDVVGKVSSTKDGGVTVATANRQQVILKPLETVKKSTTAQKTILNQATKLKPSESLKLLPRNTIAEIKEYNRLLLLSVRQTPKETERILQSQKFKNLSQKYGQLFATGQITIAKAVSIPRTITIASFDKKLGVKTRLAVAPKTKVKTAVKPKVRTITKTKPIVRTITKTRTRLKRAVKTTTLRQQRTITVSQRLYTRLKNKIPKKLRKRKLSKKEKEELVKLIKKEQKRYAPSLAAIIFGITAYKAPKSITGFEVRPIVIQKSR